MSDAKRYTLNMCDDYPECGHRLCGAVVVLASGYDALSADNARLAGELAEAQRSANDMYAGQHRLQAQVAGLKEALKPMALVPVEDFGKQDKPNSPLMGWNEHTIYVRDVLRARAALAGPTRTADQPPVAQFPKGTPMPAVSWPILGVINVDDPSDPRHKEWDHLLPPVHDSDCATNNAPALPVSPCDCRLSPPAPATQPPVAPPKLVAERDALRASEMRLREALTALLGIGPKPCGHQFDCICATDAARAELARLKNESGDSAPI